MIKKLLAVVTTLLVISIGAVAYSFLKTPEAASGPIEAIPLNSVTGEEAIAADAAPAGTVVEEVEPAIVIEQQAHTIDEAAPAQAEPGTGYGVEAEAAIAPTTENPVAGETDQNSQDTPSSPTIFEIIPAESEARFNINEVLRGEPITVVGATDQIAGQFAVNPDNLPAVQVGIIQVNARSLATDNQFRNRAIKNRILLTDAHEFVTFTPAEVTGLPETGTVGETYNFQATGDLTVTDVTRQVTFDITATAVSPTRIEAVAKTAFLYTDFELFIPDAQAVDTVDDEVRLEIEFVALAIEK